MTVKIRNIASRLVALHCNSGRTVHLPVGILLELPDVEIADNPMFEKLLNKKLLQLIDVQSPKDKSAPAALKKTLVAEDVTAKEEIASDKAQPATQGKVGKAK